MSDYQAIYDAVRSRISGGDIGAVAREVMWQHFDISHSQTMIRDTILQAVNEYGRPSAVYRPRLFADGDRWCALLGDDIQIGVTGFGKTPYDAMVAFDQAFLHESPPVAKVPS